MSERSWLRYIADIAYDRDGFHNAKDLGELVDELRQFALDGLAGKPCPLDGAMKRIPDIVPE